MAAIHELVCRIVIAALAALALTGCGPSEPSDNATGEAAAVAPADLVLRGGKVATVDPAIGDAEAIAVTGFTITAVGSNEEIAAYIGAGTEVIELDGRLAIPGFIEGHGHFLGLGRSRQILDLTTVPQLGRGGEHGRGCGRPGRARGMDLRPRLAPGQVGQRSRRRRGRRAAQRLAERRIAPTTPCCWATPAATPRLPTPPRSRRPASTPTPTTRPAAPSCARRKARPPACCVKRPSAW
jgi:hypothetical protein